MKETSCFCKLFPSLLYNKTNNLFKNQSSLCKQTVTPLKHFCNLLKNPSSLCKQTVMRLKHSNLLKNPSTLCKQIVNTHLKL